MTLVEALSAGAVVAMLVASEVLRRRAAQRERSLRRLKPLAVALIECLSLEIDRLTRRQTPQRSAVAGPRRRFRGH